MAKKKQPFNWTPKREQFCHEYVIDFNGQKAAERAGFARKSAKVTASRLLDIAPVQDRVAELSKKAQERAGVDAAYVLQRSKELVERCMQHEPVLDKNGDPILVMLPGGTMAAAYTFDAANAARGLKLLGDHIEVNAFKPEDDAGRPIDQNWVVTIVGVDGSRKTLGPGATK